MDKPIVVNYYKRTPETPQLNWPRYHWQPGVGYTEKFGIAFATREEADAWIAQQTDIFEVKVRDDSWIETFVNSDPAPARRDTRALDRWWERHSR